MKAAKQNHTSLRAYLLCHKGKVFLTFLFSLLLASSSCFLAYLVGPSLSFMLKQKQEFYLFKDLVGPYIASFIEFYFESKQINSEILLEFLVFYLVVFSLLKALFTVLQSYLWEVIGEKIALALRMRFFNAYLYTHPHQKFEMEEKGFDKNLASLISTDVKIFRDYVVSVWGGLSREIIQSVFISLSLLLLSPHLFLSFIFCLLPISYILRKMGKKLKKRSLEALDRHSTLSEWLQERFLGLETIKARRTESYEIKKMASLNEELFEKYRRLAYTASRTSPMIEMVAVIALVVVIFISLKLISWGEITASVALSFFTLLAILSQSINKLGRYFNKNKSSGGAKKRIFHFLSLCQKMERVETREILLLNEKTSKKSLILCQNLSFFYKKKHPLGLKGFNFSFLRGQFYCLTGPSGCGKSTLLKCLLDLLPYKKGKIFYAHDVVPLHKIAYISQKVSLPPISIAQCISYPQENYDEKKIETALDKVGLLEKVRGLKNGIGTLLKDEIDSGLSGGQNQRILFSRVFYHHFPLILIDEGTSSLDLQTEKKICYNLRKQIEELSTTVIFVSHSKEVMRYADEVITIS